MNKSILAAALDAMTPGSKGYIDYKNKPGYNWKTIHHAKVLLSLFASATLN